MTKHSSCERNVMPLTIAEDLCIPCSQRAVDTVSRTKTPTQKTEKAWRLLEMAHAYQGQNGARNKYVQTADTLLGQAILQKGSPRTRMPAYILQASLPAFRDRIFRRKISSQSIEGANAGFGQVLIEGFNANINDNLGWSAEALVLYLASRKGNPSENFLFPGSLREESNEKFSRFNHDVYKLWPDGSGKPSKFPLQLKRTKSKIGYEVPVLEVVPVLKPVLDTIGANTLDPLMAMAALEASGNQGSYQETALDFAGHCLAAAIETLTYQHILADYSKG